MAADMKKIVPGQFDSIVAYNKTFLYKNALFISYRETYFKNERVSFSNTKRQQVVNSWQKCINFAQFIWGHTARQHWFQNHPGITSNNINKCTLIVKEEICYILKQIIESRMNSGVILFSGHLTFLICCLWVFLYNHTISLN